MKITSRKGNQFGIRNDYQSRTSNDDYFDGTSITDDIIYQPDVYRLAHYLATRSNLKYIIDIGAGNGEKLIQYKSDFKIIALDCDVNLSELSDNLPGHEIIDCDLEKGVPVIDDEILKNSVVISSDVIEHIVDLDLYLKDIARISEVAPFVILSTPARDRVRGIEDTGEPENKAHVREWTATELDYLLNSYKFNNPRVGYTINTNVHEDKSTLVCLAGNHMLNPGIKSKPLKVQAIVTLYNENDIIDQTIRSVLRQGMDVHIIDNWSNDGSDKIVKQNMKEFPKRITYEKFPDTKPKTYNWSELLARVDEYAAKSNYDWIMHHDADEVRTSPIRSLKINEALRQIDDMGYNSVDFTVLDFRPTSSSSRYDGENPEEYFRYFEFGNRPAHFEQVKCWKNTGELVNLSDSGGHIAVKKPQKVYPIKFILKHYPLRTEKQAKKKIFSERIPRINTKESKKGWHKQYDSYQENDSYVWDDRSLQKYHKIMTYQDLFIEFISGIGIKKERV